MAAASAAANAHTPYGQWVVYRQKHLLIGSHRGDERTYELAQVVAAALAEELPEARARVARGPRPERIASLMSTGQLLLAVIEQGEAARMVTAEPPFEGYRPTPLQVVATLIDGYLLYATPDLPDDHGWRVAQALSEAGIARPPSGDGLPRHSGADIFWSGGLRPG